MRTLSILFVLLVGAACGSTQSAETKTAKMPHEHSASTNEETEPVAGPETAAENVLPNDGTRKVGDVTTCPVTEDVFLISASSPKVEHEGGTYFFCCKGCVKDFVADPAKFLAADSSRETQAPEEGGAAHVHDETHTH